MSNVKDVDLPRHARDTPPFLLIVSPTLPVQLQSVDEYMACFFLTILIDFFQIAVYLTLFVLNGILCLILLLAIISRVF